MPRQTETGSMPQMATEQQTDLQQYCHDTAAKANFGGAFGAALYTLPFAA